MSPEISALKSAGLGRTFSDEDLRELLKHGELRRVQAREVLCRQGESGETFFFLVRGTVQVYRVLPASGRIQHAPLLPGSFFGQVAVVDGQSRSATCETMSPVVVFVLSRSAFEHLRSTLPGVAIRLYRELARGLARQLRMANQRLSELEDLPGDASPPQLVSVMTETSWL